MSSENFRTSAVGKDIKVLNFIRKFLNLAPLLYRWHDTSELRCEWPSGPASSINFTEVKHGCVRSKNWMGDLPDERPKQLIPPSFGRDVKLGVPCLDAACIVGLN